jgi:DNA-binding beta-propeller fold protein YncE
MWTLVRAAEVCLFALIILFVMGCKNPCNPTGEVQHKFEYRGEIWRIWYEKGEDGFPISIVDPEGNTRDIKDPALPFRTRFIDGELSIQGIGGDVAGPAPGEFSPRAQGIAVQTPPYYIYLLSDAPQDALYILNRDTGALAGTIPLPTLPIGVGVNHSADRAYVTNLGIEAGNPFFPAAPPRVRVINKATRAVSATIDLANGLAPGKPVVSPDDRFVYVPVGADRRNFPNAASGVAIIDAQTNAVVGTIPISIVDAPVRRAAMTPDGALLFVVATESIPARVFVLDTMTREQAGMFIVPNASFRDLLVDYTGSKLYLLNQTSLVVYDTATLTETGRLTLRANGRFNKMALSTDGGSLFLNDEFSTSIVRVDTAPLRVAGDIPFTRTRTPDSSMVFIVP